MIFCFSFHLVLPFRPNPENQSASCEKLKAPVFAFRFRLRFTATPWQDAVARKGTEAEGKKIFNFVNLFYGYLLNNLLPVTFHIFTSAFVPSFFP